MPVEFRFVWAVFRDSDIFGLLLGKFIQFYADFLKMKPGNFFIQMFRENMNVYFKIFIPKCDLGKCLVCKAVTHDKTGVPCSVAKVHQDRKSTRLNSSHVAISYA